MKSPLVQGTLAVYTVHLLGSHLTDEEHCLGSPGFVFRRIPLSCLEMAPKGVSRNAKGIPGCEIWKHGFTAAAGHAAEGLLWVGFSIICCARLLPKNILEHTLHA